MVCGFLSLHTRVKSSANSSSMTGFVMQFNTSFIAIRNRDTLKTKSYGTPFSRVFGGERLSLVLTSMTLVDSKLLIKVEDISFEAIVLKDF